MEGTDEEQTDGIGATEACDQLDGFAERGTPFFLAVGFYRPHTPFVAPKAHFDAVDREAMVVPEPHDELLDVLPEPAAKSIRAMKTQIGLPTELSKEIIQAYRATVSFVDAQVGRVLDRLQEQDSIGTPWWSSFRIMAIIWVSMATGRNRPCSTRGPGCP